MTYNIVVSIVIKLESGVNSWMIESTFKVIFPKLSSSLYVSLYRKEIKYIYFMVPISINFVKYSGNYTYTML
jgi:hypothetical protein